MIVKIFSLPKLNLKQLLRIVFIKILHFAICVVEEGDIYQLYTSERYSMKNILRYEISLSQHINRFLLILCQFFVVEPPLF